MTGPFLQAQFPDIRRFTNPFDASSQPAFNFSAAPSAFNFSSAAPPAFALPPAQEITPVETVRKRKSEQEDEATSDKKQRRLRDAILLERKHAEALQTSLESHRMMVESYKSTCGAVDDEAQAMFKECLLELVDRWRRVVGGVYVFE